MAKTKPHDGAITIALNWLTKEYGDQMLSAYQDILVQLLDDDWALEDLSQDLFEALQSNLTEWILADETLVLGGTQIRVIDLLLTKGKSLFSKAQYAWIEQYQENPLGLYDITQVRPGIGFTACNALNLYEGPIAVHEVAGSQTLRAGDLIACRMMHIGDCVEISGAVYVYTKLMSSSVRERAAQHILEIDDPQGLRYEIGLTLISAWLEQAIDPPMPQMIDASSGEILQLVIDHYRIENEATLITLLNRNLEPCSSHSWVQLDLGADQQQRPIMEIEHNGVDALEARYRTLGQAERGKHYLEKRIKNCATFMRREVVDMQALLKSSRPAAKNKSILPEMDLDSAQLNIAIQSAMHRIYEHWADEPIPVLGNISPKEAIKTLAGLERVRGLIRSYEVSELEQAKGMNRTPISFSFLWQAIGLEPS